jgi:flagella synthesis protein FlgN
MQAISFDSERQLASRLLDVLASELGILTSGEIDRMEELLDQKSRLIQQLSQASHKRYQALAALGHSADEAGMQQWLQQQHSDSLTILWNDFQELLARGKEANRVNGLLINKHFNRNKQVLDVLQGVQQTGQFYGPDGQHAAGSALRGTVVA